MKKRLIICLTVAMAVIMMVGVANAKLLGIGGSMGYPDIHFNTSGYIDYDYNSATGTGTFVLQAEDKTLTYSPGVYDDLDATGKVGMTITLTVRPDPNDNENLELLCGEMTEHVDSGYVEISGKTYNECDTLLTGPVTGFGFLQVVIPDPAEDMALFDFVVTPISGLLVTDGIWPESVTGINVLAEKLFGQDICWTDDWYLEKVKGDKAPVPEPATMLLFGTGLLGLAGLRRKIKRS